MYLTLEELLEKSYPIIIKKSPGDKIYCFCMYERRDIPRNLGFSWDKDLKLWCIPKKDFTFEIYKKSSVVRFCNPSSVGPLYYFYTDYIEGDVHKYKKSNDEFKEERKKYYKEHTRDDIKNYPSKSKNKKIPKIDIDSIDFLDDD